MYEYVYIKRKDKLLLVKYFKLQSADLLFQYCLRFCNQAVLRAQTF